MRKRPRKEQPKSRGKPKAPNSRQAKDISSEILGVPEVCEHDAESAMLREVYDQVFKWMRQRAELKKQLADWERQREAYLSEFRIMREQAATAKEELHKGRMAERRYQQVLDRCVEIADEYRLSVEQSADFDGPAQNEAAPSESNSYRLRRLVQAPLERIEQLLASQGVSVQYAETGSQIDVSQFDVAAVVNDDAHQPGTVVRTHQPAYLRQDGSIVRKGAAIVTGLNGSEPSDA